MLPGAIACAYEDSSVSGETFRYYALIFLGADSTSNSDFYAGQGTGMDGLRSGIFLARLEP